MYVHGHAWIRERIIFLAFFPNNKPHLSFILIVKGENSFTVLCNSNSRIGFLRQP